MESDRNKREERKYGAKVVGRCVVEQMILGQVERRCTKREENLKRVVGLVHVCAVCMVCWEQRR